MATSETVLLKSTLEIDNKAYSVKLTPTELYWEAVTTTRAASGPYSEPLVTTENQSVKLSEIIAVRLGERDHHGHKVSTTAGASSKGKGFSGVELESLAATAWSVWLVQRLPGHRWKERRVTFRHDDTSLLTQWVDKIQQMLDKPELRRPKSLLVFINPVGGKKVAVRTYRDKVAPLFELAGITTDVIHTQRQYHARDTLLDYDLDKVDGVVCVGGDGMFTEIVHGLMKRTLKDAGLGEKPEPAKKPPTPRIRIGIIPAGSTDTVIFTLCGERDPTRSTIHIILGSTNTTIFSLQGSTDPKTSTLHILIGDTIAMDLATVHHGNEFLKYNVSLNGYGFYGDCLVDSERNRWMGPKRYDWAGFKMLMKNQRYEGELSYLPSTDTENHPRDQTFCKAGCQVCQSSVEQAGAEAGAGAGAGDAGAGLEEVDLEKGWVKLKGRFVAVNSFLISCRSHFSREGPAPACHLGDGNADLVILHECGRLDNLKHLVRCKQEGNDQFAFPFVHVARVKEYRFRPPAAGEEEEDAHEGPGGDGDTERGGRLRSQPPQPASVWNCDGELLSNAAIDFRVHRQVLNLFARGVEDEVRGDNAPCSCLGCVKS